MKIKSNRKKRVLVAMSGGVDSSVAAFLLKQKGYEVVGVTMCFGLRDSDKRRPSCCSESGIEDARRVAQQLEINHYVLSFGTLLKEKVIGEFLKEYLCGRTPNPCIRCNQYLKFDALIKRAKELDCHYLATGHYARLTQDKRGRTFLKKAKDTKKDQSYFLFRMPRQAMSSIIFPLANYTKDEVRIIARENRLRVAEKPASQDICFVDTDYHKFIKHRLSQMKIEITPGPIVDLQGKVLGQHKGIYFYTIGQREGLGIAHKCVLYVVGINAKTNTLIVGEKKDVYQDKLQARELHLLALSRLPKRLVAEAKIRYNHPQARAVVMPLSKGRVRVEFRQPQWAITPGQSVVLYQGDTVIGGATIDKVLTNEK